MANEYTPWWANRLGQVAAATVTGSQPVPVFGAAADIATTRFTPEQYESALNAIQTFSDNRNVELSVQRQGVGGFFGAGAAGATPFERDMLAQEEARLEQEAERQDRIEELRERIALLESERDQSEMPQHEFASFAPENMELGKLKAELAALEKEAEGATGHRSLPQLLAGIDPETGLNRTERGWLAAQANQHADIRGAGPFWQHDAELIPELRSAAERALKTGEWTDELLEAYERYQASTRGVDAAVMRPLDKIEDFYQAWMARPLSTAGQVLAQTQGDLTRGQLPDVPGLFEAETWRQAWERAENVTPGQSVADLALMERDDVQEAYAEGFDEFGNPINQAYYDLRKGAAYNVTSGVSDFAVRWYADPLVIGGKAAGAARAISKADWDRMPAWARRRIEHIVTAPADYWHQVRASIPSPGRNPLKWSIDQRAVKLRESMYDLRDMVRSDPEKYDPVWLADNVPAFKDDLRAAGYFHEAANKRVSSFNPQTGKWEPEMRDARTPEEIEAARLSLERQLRENPAAVKISGEFRLHRIDPEWDPKASRPEGQYYTPVWEEDFVSVYKEDYDWRGQEHWAVGKHKNVLKPSPDIADYASLTPGELAVAQLLGEEKFHEIIRKGTVMEEIKSRFPGLDLKGAGRRDSVTYHMEILGAQLARMHGYDGILKVDYDALENRLHARRTIERAEREPGLPEAERQRIAEKGREELALANRDHSEFVDLSGGKFIEDMGENASEVLAREKLTPVYDDELWELSVAASFGNGKARAELAENKELLDQLYALSVDELESVNRQVERMKFAWEDALTDPDLNDWQRFERSYAARESMEEAMRRADELEGMLSEYDSYHTFVNNVLDSPDTHALRYGQFKPKRQITKKLRERITTYTLRPTGASRYAVTATRIPRAAWFKRAQAVDLSGHGSLQEQAPRVFDDIAKTSDFTTITAIAMDAGFDDWEHLKRAMLNRAAGLRTDTERLQFMTQLDNLAVTAVAEKHGFTSDEALKISQELSGRKEAVYRTIRARAAEAKASGLLDEDIRRYTYAEGDHLHHVDFPISLTQLGNTFVPTDLRELDRFLRMHKAALKNSFRAKLYRAQDIAIDALELFNTYWKVGVLFRFGYPTRTVSEETFRILAHTGSFQNMLLDLPKAFGIGVVNTGKRTANVAMRHMPRLSKAKGGNFQIIDQAGTGHDAIEVLGHKFSQAGAVGRGDVYWTLASSDPHQHRLYQTYKRNLGELHRHGIRTRRTQAGEQGHISAWLHVLNNQVFSDPIWRQMIDGATDEDILTWLRKTPEGREAVRRNPRRGRHPERWVEDMRRELDTLAPTDVLRAKMASGKKLTEKDLLQVDVDQIPVAIDEAALQLVQGRGHLAQAVDRFVEQGYHLLATLPTDTLARHPFFNRQYRAFLARQAESLPDDMVLTAKQTAAFERQARSFALAQTRRYLFNLADETDLIHMMRFFWPFASAWGESMRAWGRIFTENPEALARLGVHGWQSMGDLWFAEEVDIDGRTKDDPNHGDLDTLMISVPNSMVKKLGKLIPGFKPEVVELLDTDSDGAVLMPIRKDTLNTTLQGDPFWLPGNGALVQLFGKWAVGDMPELSDENAISSFLHKYVFPTGVPRDALDALMPTLAQRVRRYVDGLEDPVFRNTAVMIQEWREFQWREGGMVGPRPSEEESLEMAKVMQATYVAGAALSPFSFQFENPGQFYVDMAHRYQQDYGWEEGYVKFIEDFGEDAFLFWYSNSKSNTGVPATSAGFKQQKKHRDLIQQYPDIGLAIVGMDTLDQPFNYNVYSLQGQMPVAPWDPRPQRERDMPEDAVARAEAGQGWFEWRQLNTAIDAELMARGSFEIVNGEHVPVGLGRQENADLALLKRMAVEELRRKYPGWGDEYDKTDRGRSYNIVDQFRGLIHSGQAPNRLEWEGLAEYLEIHDAVAMELDARKADGLSSNIETEGNEDLKFIFDTAVAELVQRNLVFADVYHRFLERHTLTNGSNGAL